jgi:hypothetical protein
MTKNTGWVVGLLAIGVTAGLAIGASLGTPAATAQGRAFRECTAATMWLGSGRDLASGRPAQSVAIPPGWTPFAGASARNEPVLIVCR